MAIDFYFGRPVMPLTKAVVSSGFGRPRPSGKISNRHPGIDIPVKTGTPVLAMADGVVMRSQKTEDGADAGIFVGIQHPLIVSRYMHLSRNLVDVGQEVRKGQVIGYSGSTGLSSGPHLHVDLKVKDPKVLAKVIEAVGEPVGGFIPFQERYGIGIPAEPWVPVDGYSDRTINDAKTHRIPLYPELHNQSIIAAKIANVGDSLHNFMPLLALLSGAITLTAAGVILLRRRVQTS